MEKVKHAEKIAQALKELYPEAPCALESGSDPFRLLVMARLSAQCTDARVNEVSLGLFQRYPTAEAMAQADLSELEALIRPCGLHRSKAKHLKEMSIMLLDRFEGKVPREMEDLLALPGVGRKIANLIRGDLYGLGGIVADTHCIRLCGRFGFYDSEIKDPVRVERLVTPLIPASEQSDFCHRLVMFGREWCSARAPRCGECPLASLCPAGNEKKKP